MTIRREFCVGVLAHVDAGKTTLSEALLYLSGKIKKLGRVDHREDIQGRDAEFKHPLPHPQQLYAATDAWVCRSIYLALNGKEVHQDL